MSGSINSTAKSAAGVALFAFLSYAIAWALILPSIPNVFDLIRADEKPAEPDISIFTAFAMFALCRALVMRLFVSKEVARLAGSAAQVSRRSQRGLEALSPGRTCKRAVKANRTGCTAGSGRGLSPMKID
jgi:hypothetical protein